MALNQDVIAAKPLFRMPAGRVERVVDAQGQETTAYVKGTGGTPIFGALVGYAAKKNNKDYRHVTQAEYIAAVEDLRANNLLKPVLDEGRKQLLRSNPKLYLDDYDGRVNQILTSAASTGKDTVTSLQQAGLSDEEARSIARTYEDALITSQKALLAKEYPTEDVNEAMKLLKEALTVTAT